MKISATLCVLLGLVNQACGENTTVGIDDLDPDSFVAKADATGDFTFLSKTIIEMNLLPILGTLDGNLSEYIASIECQS
jgi:hypothetical protein